MVVQSLGKESENEYGLRTVGLTTPSVLMMVSSEGLAQIATYGEFLSWYHLCEHHQREPWHSLWN